MKLVRPSMVIGLRGWNWGWGVNVKSQRPSVVAGTGRTPGQRDDWVTSWLSGKRVLEGQLPGVADVRRSVQPLGVGLGWLH